MKNFRILKKALIIFLCMLLGCFVYHNTAAQAQEVSNPAAVRSLIEQGFPSGLKQIGYDFFQNFQMQGMGKYDNDYTLSIGEKLSIYCWGDSVNVMSLSGSSLLSPLTQAQVDSKGDLFIPGIGVVKAEGKTISEVEKNIQSLANNKFKSVKVKLNVADSSDFVVFVYGFVNKPGKIALSNNSTIIEALAAAGGVNKNGSLRNIVYRSGDKSQKVDLYEIIFSGKPSSVKIKPNDTIFVNNIGNVTAVKNGVKIPGIYELKESETLNDLLSFAGGLLPSTDNKTANIKSYDKKQGQRVSKDIQVSNFTNETLKNGDIVEFGDLFAQADNFISLVGQVKHPGIFQYKKDMKLSDVIKDKSELQDETLLHQAVIKRISPIDKQLKTIPVSLEDFFEGGNNPYLEPKDVITVYKSTSASFIEVYGCINKPKNVPYNNKLTLKDILTDIQFIAAYNTNNKNIVEISDKNIDGKKENITLPIETSNNNLVIPASNVAIEITNSKNFGKLKTYYLLDILVKRDLTSRIKIEPNDKILFRTLRDDEVLKTVKVSGYVNNPGVYSFIKGKNLKDMIELSGGLKEDANLKGIVFKRESLSSTLRDIAIKKDKKDMDLIQGQMLKDKNLTAKDIESQKLMIDSINEDKVEDLKEFDGRIVLNIKTNDINALSEKENIEIQDGDEIYIPKIPGYVSVMGEVYNESSFIYKPKKKASYYIDLVGGYTPNAKKNKIYKISADGKASKLKNLSARIEPGDTIIIPRKIKSNDWLTTVMKTMQIVANTMSSVFVLTKI